MTADPILTLAWLALAHLVADFVIQTNRVATEKFGFGRRAWQALGVHGLGAAILLLPFVLAFGLPGVALLVVVSAAHGAIDRVKILWTMGVEAQALAEARALHEGPAPDASLGTAWTPIPAFLFLLDQLAHAMVLLAAWALFIANAPVTSELQGGVRTLIGSADPATFHHVVLMGVVLLDLAIVNVRAASLFVATLVHPREVVLGDELTPSDATGEAATAAEAPAPPSVRDAAAAAEPTASADVGDETAAAKSAAPPEGGPAVILASAPTRIARPRPPGATVASPARVGAAIGVLERLLIVAFVLSNATSAVGFVVAAKTIARFKQLDDRQFAEYYLLGTLASVSVALASALVAAAALTA